MRLCAWSRIADSRSQQLKNHELSSPRMDVRDSGKNLQALDGSFNGKSFTQACVGVIDHFLEADWTEIWHTLGQGVQVSQPRTTGTFKVCVILRIVLVNESLCEVNYLFKEISRRGKLALLKVYVKRSYEKPGRFCQRISPRRIYNAQTIMLSSSLDIYHRIQES